MCITDNVFRTHHCFLYQKVGWPSLTVKRNPHWYPFIYKCLSQKLPPHLALFLRWKNSAYVTRSQDRMSLEVPRANSNLGNTAFSFCAPDTWNLLQCSLKLDSIVLLSTFRKSIFNMISLYCDCFN